MHICKRHVLGIALLLTSLGMRAQALSPPVAEAAYPANALRCVVVAGGSVRYADAKAQELAATMNRSVTNFVNAELNARHYESAQVFHEPEDLVRTRPNG